MPHTASLFEKIIMPPVVLAGLYSRSLVIVEQITAPPQPINFPGSMLDEIVPIQLPSTFSEMAALKNVTPKKLNWLGDFKKQVAVFVDDADGVHACDEALALLTKMLQAVKLSLADIALINIHQQTIDWTDFDREMDSKTALFFGVDAAAIGLPMRLQNFKAHKWGDTILLQSPSLSEINKPSPEQNTLKKALWQALQEIFTGG